VPFECSQCGECCSHLGLVHRIKEDLGNGRFLLLNQYTGEVTDVAIDSDKVALYSDTGTFLREPEACPFFRIRGDDNKGYCTVHRTRPEICRDFSCWRVLILDAEGRRAGRIMFHQTFVPEDPALSALWEERIAPLPSDDDAAWVEDVVRILIEAGYTVRT
jgi:Fe-S-cluster containining protein